MNLLRGWLFYIVLSFSILVLAVCVLCTTPFASVKWRYEAICRPWAKFVLALLRVICGIRLEMKGMENLPPADTQAVVLMKHQSAWDPFWLGAYLPAPACFIYKRSINWIPVLGWVVCAMDMLAIDRSKGRSAFEAFMKKGPVKAPACRRESACATRRAAPASHARAGRPSCPSATMQATAGPRTPSPSNPARSP